MNTIKHIFKQSLKKCLHLASKCKFHLLYKFYKPLSTVDYDYSQKQILNTYTPKTIYTNYNEPFKYEVSLCLSIIIPVYNVKNYLPRCIESLIQPTDYTYEIILIDDSSTDGSSEICDDYAKKYNSIKVIHQKHTGVSSSRNKGIVNSRGKYILFIDSDDYLLKGALTNINLANLTCDVFQFRHHVSSNNKIIFKSHKFSNNNPKVLNLYYGYLWNKFYKREIFTHIKNPVGYWFEDMINDLIIFPSSQNIMKSNQITYSYILNDNGITAKSRNSYKILDSYFVLKEIIEHIDDYKIDYTIEHFKRLLYQSSSQIYARIRKQKEEIIKNCFILLCKLINETLEKYSFSLESLNKYERYLTSAFNTHNYLSWKNISQFYE